MAEYNQLRLKVLERFREEFEQGRRIGNAERGYNQTLRETHDRYAAERVRNEILGSAEIIPSFEHESTTHQTGNGNDWRVRD